MNSYELKVKSSLMTASMIIDRTSAQQITQDVKDTLANKTPLTLMSENITIVPHDLLSISVITITKVNW